MYESLSTFTSLERVWNLALLQSKTLIINIYYNTKMGESTSKFDFERIVPVFLREPSRSIFCANRPGRIVPGRNWFLRDTSRNLLDHRYPVGLTLAPNPMGFPWGGDKGQNIGHLYNMLVFVNTTSYSRILEVNILDI